MCLVEGGGGQGVGVPQKLTLAHRGEGGGQKGAKFAHLSSIMRSRREEGLKSHFRSWRGRGVGKRAKFAHIILQQPL